MLCYGATHLKGLAITQLMKQERNLLEDNELEEGKVGSTTLWQVGKGEWGRVGKGTPPLPRDISPVFKKRPYFNGADGLENITAFYPEGVTQ